MKSKRDNNMCRPLAESDTKVQSSTDLTKVIDHFRYTSGTTLMCAMATGIGRGSVCWYVGDLEDMGILRVDHMGIDPYTGREAKFYATQEGGAR